MMLFWFLFGRLLGMPWKPLLDPVINLFHMVTAGAGLLVFTVGLLGALHHQTGQLIAGLAGLAVWGCLLTVLGASRASRTQTAQYEQARVAAGKPPRSRLYRFLWGDPSTGSRWVQPTGAMVMGIVLGSFIYGIFAAIAAAIMHWMGRGIPRLGTTVQVELIVMTVALLAGCCVPRPRACGAAYDERLVHRFGSQPHSRIGRSAPQIRADRRSGSARRPATPAFVVMRRVH